MNRFLLYYIEHAKTFSQYIPAIVSSLSFHTMQSSLRERQASAKNYSDELDSILSRLQYLNVDSPKEEENDNKDTQVIFLQFIIKKIANNLSLSYLI